LVALGKIKPPRYYVSHRARKGDTLGRLAKRYRTTVKAIQRANKLRSTKIYARKVYRIPKHGGVRPAPAPLHLPPRRLPPAGTPASSKVSTRAAPAAARAAVPAR
jgi:penicillin-insensitive murein endopeptidase